MKVLFFSDTDQLYGASKSLFDLVVELKKMGIIPVVITSSVGPLNEKLDYHGIENYYVKTFPFMFEKSVSSIKNIVNNITFYTLTKIRNKFFNYRAKKLLLDIIDFNEIDLIYSNTNRIDIGAFISNEFNKPHVWHLREFVGKDYKLIINKTKYIDYMDKNADKFIAISDAVLNEWVRKGLPSSKIKRVYNGIDFDEILLKDSKLDKIEKCRFIFVGSINEAKQQIQLIEAYNLLPDQIAENISIHFYGTGDSDYITDLKSKINNGYRNNVVFKGYCSDIKSILKDYDVGILCSSSEGFGRVTVEYMAAGLFVIGSNTGANPELINKDNGILYEYSNIESLKEKIVEVYENLNNIRRRSFEIRSATITKFDKKRYATEIYYQIMSLLKH